MQIFNKIQYVWSKIIKRLPGVALINTRLERPSKIEPRSTVINSDFGKYSYCGYGCKIVNCSIGNFVSIADHVVIGGASHPLSWVSTSPAFYKGKDSIPKNLATLEYDSSPQFTNIGHDVWIGEGAYIKGGVRVGNGAVIGMNSVVTKDVPPYAIVAGCPASTIRYRFDDSTIQRLQRSKWWDYKIEDLQNYSRYMNDVNLFLNIVERINV